jgi:hypothetical protein
LAIGCAAAGDFDLASEYGQKAYKAAPKEYQKEIQERNDSYEAKKPVQPK